MRVATQFRGRFLPKIADISVADIPVGGSSETPKNGVGCFVTGGVTE